MIERLEEETRANGYIVKEQLPKDIASHRKMIQDLQKVVAVPAMGQSDLDDLNNQVTTSSISRSNSNVTTTTSRSKQLVKATINKQTCRQTPSPS